MTNIPSHYHRALTPNGKELFHDSLFCSEPIDSDDAAKAVIITTDWFHFFWINDTTPCLATEGVFHILNRERLAAINGFAIYPSIEQTLEDKKFASSTSQKDVRYFRINKNTVGLFLEHSSECGAGIRLISYDTAEEQIYEDIYPIQTAVFGQSAGSLMAVSERSTESPIYLVDITTHALVATIGHIRHYIPTAIAAKKLGQFLYIILAGRKQNATVCEILELTTEYAISKTTEQIIQAAKEIQEFVLPEESDDPSIFALDTQQAKHHITLDINENSSSPETTITKRQRVSA